MQNTSKGFHLREPSDYYNLDNIENYNTQKANDLIEEIDNKMMPGTNTTDNQLANKDFVNSSITHNAANFRGNWNNWTSVPSDYTQYPEDAKGNKKPTPNDYLVISNASDYTVPGLEGTWRFKYIGEWDDLVEGVTRGKSGWLPEYQVNEKPLTVEQIAALNSGINETKVLNYDSHIANTNNPHAVTKDQLNLGNVDNTSDANKPISQQQQTEFNKKVNIAQGTQYAGKVLGIGSDGNVVPTDVQGGGGATPEQLATKLDKTPEAKKIAVVKELPACIDLYTIYFVVEEEGEWPGLKLTNKGSTVAGGAIRVYNEGLGKIRPDIWISYDGKNWTKYNLDAEAFELTQNQSLYIWNKDEELSKVEAGSTPTQISKYSYLNIHITGDVDISGNIMSLVNFSELSDGCFYRLFYQSNILDASSLYLPEKKLASYCYSEMFREITNITLLPELPADTLATGCYMRMFNSMTSTSAITAPVLPATRLESYCYYSMFSNAMVNNIELKATTLAEACYNYMLYNASTCNSIKLYYSGNFESIYFNHWVENVATEGTLYYNGQDTTRGESAIPQSWSVNPIT